MEGLKNRNIFSDNFESDDGENWAGNVGFYQFLTSKILNLFDDNNFEKTIFYDFNGKKSMSEMLGLDSDTQNSYFGLMLRDLVCDMQEFDPCDIIQLQEKISIDFGDIMPELQAKTNQNTTTTSITNRRRLSSGMMLEDTDDFGDVYSELSLQFHESHHTSKAKIRGTIK